MNNRELSVNKITDLSTAEKMDLFAFSHTTNYQSVLKLMEFMVIGKRDAAADIGPADKAKQEAAWTEANVMKQLYFEFRQRVEEAVTTHLAEIKQKAHEETLKDQEEIERIMLGQ